MLKNFSHFQSLKLIYFLPSLGGYIEAINDIIFISQNYFRSFSFINNHLSLPDRGQPCDLPIGFIYKSELFMILSNKK